MKTLAELKREANSGNMALELVERYGSTEIIDRLKGIRKVIKANSVGLVLRNLDGQESRMDIKKATLMEYDGETLKIFNPGIRPLNSGEAAALAKAEKARIKEDENDIIYQEFTVGKTEIISEFSKSDRYALTIERA